MRDLVRAIPGGAEDLAPVFLVVAFFQTAVPRQPVPDPGDLLIGAVFVVVGLSLFVLSRYRRREVSA